MNLSFPGGGGPDPLNPSSARVRLPKLCWTTLLLKYFKSVTYISQTTIFNYQTCPTLRGSLFINHCDHVTITCSMMKRATHGNAWGNGGWIKQGLQWFIQQISDEKDKTFTPFTWSNSTCQTAFRFTVKIKLWLIVLECFYDNCKSKYLLLVYINKCHKL